MTDAPNPWPRPEGCDAESPSIYTGRDGKLVCRCLVCGRCKHHTGNSTQGHYWKWCKVTRSMRDFHLCCPDDCQLEADAAADRAEAAS